jgi:hypothetical protein
MKFHENFDGLQGIFILKLGVLIEGGTNDLKINTPIDL